MQNLPIGMKIHIWIAKLSLTIRMITIPYYWKSWLHYLRCPRIFRTTHVWAISTLMSCINHINNADNYTTLYYLFISVSDGNSRGSPTIEDIKHVFHILFRLIRKIYKVCVKPESQVLCNAQFQLLPCGHFFETSCNLHVYWKDIDWCNFLLWNSTYIYNISIICRCLFYQPDYLCFLSKTLLKVSEAFS